MVGSGTRALRCVFSLVKSHIYELSRAILTEKGRGIVAIGPEGLHVSRGSGDGL